MNITSIKKKRSYCHLLVVNLLCARGFWNGIIHNLFSMVDWGRPLVVNGSFAIGEILLVCLRACVHTNLPVSSTC